MAWFRNNGERRVPDQVSRNRERDVGCTTCGFPIALMDGAEETQLLQATTMIRGLVAGLLVMATLIMFAGAVSDRTFDQADLIQPSETVINDIVLTDEQVWATGQAVTASHDTKRLCSRRGMLPGTARCQSTQCIIFCGGLPATMFAFHPLFVDGVRHTLLADRSLCGISTPPDLPPPRPSA